MFPQHPSQLSVSLRFKCSSRPTFCVTKLVKVSCVNASRTLSTRSTETGTSVLTPLKDHESAKTSTSTSSATIIVEIPESRGKMAETLSEVFTTLKL